MKWIITGWFKGKEFTDQPGWFNWSVDGNRIDRLLSLFTIEKQCKRLAGQDKSIARDFYSFERRRNRVWKRKIDDACLRPRLSYNAKVQRCWFFTRNAGISVPRLKIGWKYTRRSFRERFVISANDGQILFQPVISPAGRESSSVIEFVFFRRSELLTCLR